MTPHTIAVIDGTGPQGRGLGLRQAGAGHDIVLGSRDAERAGAAALTAVIEPAEAVTGRPGISCGSLRMARRLEPLTAALICVSRIHEVHSGIRLTGLVRERV